MQENEPLFQKPEVQDLDSFEVTQSGEGETPLEEVKIAEDNEEELKTLRQRMDSLAQYDKELEGVIGDDTTRLNSLASTLEGIGIPVETPERSFEKELACTEKIADHVSVRLSHAFSNPLITKPIDIEVNDQSNNLRYVRGCEVVEKSKKSIGPLKWNSERKLLLVQFDFHGPEISKTVVISLFDSDQTIMDALEATLKDLSEEIKGAGYKKVLIQNAEPKKAARNYKKWAK
jgi:hypothetical protein